MALKAGFNITASDAKALLERNDKQKSGVRTWRQLFGNASLGYSAQKDRLTTDYAGAIAAAYESNFRQNNAIMNAGLNVGATKSLLNQSRANLQSAYETYVRNYGKDMTTLNENYTNEASAINAELTGRAQNLSNLYANAYKYLSDELFGASRLIDGTAKNGAKAIRDKNGNITGYEKVRQNYFKEHGLDWTLDETGKLRAWNDIATELVDEDGNLKAEGIAFFDQMFNSTYEPYTHQKGNRNIYGFDEWLSNVDPKLRDWWASQDNYNYTRAGTNAGTAKSLLGLESTDVKYNKSDYEQTREKTVYETPSRLPESVDKAIKTRIPDYTDADTKDGGQKFISSLDIDNLSTDVENIINDYLKDPSLIEEFRVYRLTKRSKGMLEEIMSRIPESGRFKNNVNDWSEAREANATAQALKLKDLKTFVKMYKDEILSELEHFVKTKKMPVVKTEKYFGASKTSGF
jgi:hypothetical protein